MNGKPLVESYWCDVKLFGAETNMERHLGVLRRAIFQDIPGNHLPHLSNYNTHSLPGKIGLIARNIERLIE